MKSYFKEKTTIVPFVAVTGNVARMSKTIKHKENGDIPVEDYIIFVVGGNIVFTKEIGERFQKEYLEWLDYQDYKELMMSRMTEIYQTGEPDNEVGEMRFKSMDEKISDQEIKNPINIIPNDKILKL